MSNVTREELRTVEVFHDLPDEQLDWFLEHSTEVRMQPGEIYVRAGDACRQNGGRTGRRTCRGELRERTRTCLPPMRER